MQMSGPRRSELQSSPGSYHPSQHDYHGHQQYEELRRGMSDHYSQTRGMGLDLNPRIPAIQSNSGPNQELQHAFYGQDVVGYYSPKPLV